MTDPKERRKLARERLRRLRALAEQRKLLEKAKAPAAKAEKSAAEKAPRVSNTASNQLDQQRQTAINALERDITELDRLADPSDATSDDISRLRREVEELKRDFYSHLDSWQRLQLARHPQRPYTDDFIRLLFENFSEIHGDRNFADDRAMIAGMARFHGRPVLIVGNQKGRDTKQRLARNFGQAKPEGYRKALRAMHLAAKFGRPIFVFVDTQGAYPGIDAEERGQAEAIAHNIREMSRLPVPIVVAITGEGGSGGALAIAIGDRVLMLENSVYSVISPEGCASIVWRDSTKAEIAAEALKITASNLLELQLIDEIVPEPEGGAHTDHAAAAKFLDSALSRLLDELSRLSPEELLQQRYHKFRRMGQFFA
ncbi:MAG TPA: acetyl-CoA carboxylase carboxyltransferase subunit alpha [Candidatus Acidoferrales bacterium]|nr:acetyl-CoA carboxylase carboxyltransferase subunit alpha [Candidatus Acidoferrales bacterium]